MYSISTYMGISWSWCIGVSLINQLQTLDWWAWYYSIYALNLMWLVTVNHQFLKFKKFKRLWTLTDECLNSENLSSFGSSYRCHSMRLNNQYWGHALLGFAGVGYKKARLVKCVHLTVCYISNFSNSPSQSAPANANPYEKPNNIIVQILFPSIHKCAFHRYSPEKIYSINKGLFLGVVPRHGSHIRAGTEMRSIILYAEKFYYLRISWLKDWYNSSLVIQQPPLIL